MNLTTPAYGGAQTRTCRWQKVPVDAGIAISLPKCIDLREESIHYLLPAEDSDRVLMGYNGHYVAFPERKQVRECNTLATDDPPAIGKCGCDRKNGIAAERATLCI
jgi:hypothetical protein